MKTLKKVLSLAAALVMLVTLGLAPVKSYAADATTWYVRYDVNSGRWFVSTDLTDWKDANLDSLQAGDKVVIDACGEDAPELILTAYQNIGELAFTSKANAKVTAPYVASVYTLNDAIGVVNANVGTADSYYGTVMQVNGNVEKFTGHYDPDEAVINTFAVTGTVGEANVKFTGNRLSNSTTIYNVAADAFKTDAKGLVNLTESQYSLTAPAASATVTAENPASEKVLDSVPNTGSFGVEESMVFFMLSAVFAIGAVVYKKKIQ